MRAVLQAISDELLRLRAEGETTVPVTEETLAGLRALVKSRIAASAPAQAEPLAPAAAAGQGGISRTREPAAASAFAAYLSPDKAKPSSPSASGFVAPPARAAAAAASAPAAPVLPPPPVVALPDGDKAARWAALKQLATTHPTCVAQVRPGKKAVFGVGSLDAKIIFIGDAPGLDEETGGTPFVGAAGELLTKMIGAMGLKRDRVYITHIVCWRPRIPTPEGAEQLGDRSPTPEEIAFCLPFLRAVIDIVQPEMLVVFGKDAAQGLLGEKITSLGAVRSQWREFAGKPLMVTYHPDYLLRNGTNKSKRAVWEDLLQVMEKAALPISEKQRGYFL